MNEVAGRTSGRDAFERVETLIPHKEPEWKPRQKLGKLDPRWHTWTAARKLGEYLLSSEQSPMLDELSRVCAAYLLEVEPEDLVAAGEGEITNSENRILAAHVGDPGTYSAFRLPGLPTKLIVVAYGSNDLYGIGDHCYHNGAELNIMKLPTIVGLSEIISSVGGIEKLRGLAAAGAETKFKLGAFDRRKRFALMEERGCVEVREESLPRTLAALRDGSAGPAWATVDTSHGKGLRREYLHATDYLLIKGTDEEIQAKADRQAAAASKNIPWELKKILCDDDGAEKRGWLGPILQEAIRNVWGDEACREANRLYAEQDKDKHIAGVFDDKKQCDEAHRDAASSGYVAKSFGHVEIDDDVDLAEYEKIALELEARFRSRELPQITPADHELRFRKCGRHRAIGVYNPLRRAVAVDPRAPRSLLHELAHAYDFEHGQMSCSQEFRQVIEAFARGFEPGDMSAGKEAYYKTPTEIFARGWEAYAALNGFGGSFVGALDEYKADVAYSPLIENAELINSYFDEFAKPLEVAHVVSAQERAVDIVRAGDEREFAALRRQVAAGEVDAFQLRADLGGGMGLAAEEERRMGELMTASLLAPSACVGPEVGDAAGEEHPRGAEGGRRGCQERPAQTGEQMALF